LRIVQYICFLHEGVDPLRCWRTPGAMLAHVYGHYLKDLLGRGALR
jgi:hypothetical protein